MKTLEKMKIVLDLTRQKQKSKNKQKYFIKKITAKQNQPLQLMTSHPRYHLNL